MSDQYITRSVTPVTHRRVNPDVTPVDMLEAQFTPVKEAQVRHHICPRCRFTYPETEMVQVGGTWYCSRLKHAQDAMVELATRK